MKKVYFVKGIISLVFAFILSIGLNAQTTWYAINSGDWDNTNNWTLDPAAAVHYNPSNSFPQLTTDNVVIKTGVTITVPVKDPALVLNCGTITVDGRLDLGTTTGHTFAVIRGSGRILMKADNFPTGNATHFVTKGQGEGTVVFQGNSFAITNARTFYNMEVQMNAGQALSIGANVNLNGNLNVITGALNIGNSTTARTLVVNGNVTVDNGATFGVGDFNANHIIDVYGNIVNNGIIKFTRLAVPTYNSVASVGRATLTVKGTTNNSLTANGTTDLHRLVVNKGDDATYAFSVNSSNNGNFRLFGQNNTASKALEIVGGTLKLTGQLLIPTLTEGGSNFTIPAAGGLWIDGSGVTVNITARNNSETTVGGVTGTGVSASGDNESLSISGRLTIANGLLDAKSNGILVSDDANALVLIEGGTLLAPGIRSAGAGNGKWTYNQSGGLVQLYGDVESNLSSSGAPTFQIKGSSNAFIMSGGVLEILDAATSSNLAIGIESAEGSHSITGGTVRINRINSALAGAGNTFVINSTAPFFNLELSVQNSTHQANVSLSRALTVLNNFLIQNRATLDVSTSNHSLTVGGDFTVQSGGAYNAQANTTIFAGSRDAVITNNSTSVIAFHNLTINKLPKPGGDYAMLLAGSNTISINSNLLLSNGNLNLADKSVSVKGNVSVFNGSILSTSLDGLLILDGTAKQTLYSDQNKNRSFGNLDFDNRLSTGDNIELGSNIKANRIRLIRDSGQRQVVNLDIFNLEADVADFSSGTWSATRMFKTTGKASDGGLTLPVTIQGNYTNSTVQRFPMGYGTTYTFGEVFVNGNNLNGAGKLTLIPVNGEHPSQTSSGNGALAFYFRVINEGFAGVTGSNMTYTFRYPDTWGGNSWKGVVLNNYKWEDYDITEVAKVNNQYTDTRYNFLANLPLEGDYTVGNNSAFNNLNVYYSKASGDWHLASTWTLSNTHIGANAGPPQRYDIAVIGGSGTSNHVVRVVNDNTRVSQVEIKGSSETGIGGTPPTLQMVNQNGNTEIPLIKGRGRIIYPNNLYIKGNHAEFSNNNEAIIEFNGTGRTLDVSPNVPFFPNLHFTGNGTWIGPNANMVVNGNLYVDSLSNGSFHNVSFKTQRNLEVKGNLKVGNGTFSYPDNNNADYTVYGDIIIEGTGSVTLSGAMNQPGNNMFLYGNINQGNGVVDFFGQNNSKNVTLHFLGNNSVTVSKTNASKATEFFRIVVNKPEGQHVRFNRGFTLHGATNGSSKALEIQSGIVHLNSSGINISLSSGGDNFNIPSNGALIVENNAITNITGDNTGLRLSGLLRVGLNGVANLNGGNNNYIEYTSSGKSEINVSEHGQLYVGSQVRRSLTTEAGILKFVQSGGNSIVEIGGKGVPASGNTRGVFEILNPGSSFVMGSDARLTLKNGKSGGFDDLYFAPSTVSLGTGSSINIEAGTAGAAIFDMYVAQPLNNLTFSGVVIAQLRSLPLTLNGNLTINTGATFNANGLDVNIKGNMVNAGTYNAAGNTTYFSGNANQAITGATTFHNLVKNGGTARLTLSNATPVTVSNNLTLTSGSFDTGINSVIVRGNTRIDEGFSTLSSGASEGFVLQGSTQQRLTGSGTFARLTVDNINGVIVPTQSSSVNYSDQLRLKQGVLDIGRNLMILEKNAVIVAVNPFSSSNMIQTNLSFTDAGIMKYIPAGAQTVVYPIGSGGKYTPVTLNITANTADNGFVRVKAANEPHITILEANRNNVLNYNWTLDAGGVSGFSGNAVMQAIPDDAKVTAPNTLNNYIAARILAGGIDWNKLENIYQGPDLIEGFNKDTYQLVFRFNNTNATLINGDYTAGVATAIPDQVPSYITVNNGNWTSVSTWATYNPITNVTGAAGVNIPAGGPRGSIVLVNHNLVITDNFMSAYRTRINASGVVNIGNTINHRFGTVSGQGRLVLQNGSFPAGTYDDFFAPTGGTVEFAGSNDYDILSELPMVNNVVFSGTGTRRMSNLETIVFNGNMELSGPVLVNEFSKINAVKGNIVFNSGSYVAKEGSIAMSGTNIQTIGGSASFTGTSGLYNLIINNGVGVTLQNNLEVKNELTFTKGVINSSDAAIITITNTNTNAITGASAASYVNGPLRKNINAGNAFIYPVGKEGRYGQLTVNNVSIGGLWMVDYFNNGASDRGTFDGTVKYVSSNEYWNVTAPSAGAQAIVTLRWDANSGVNPDDDAFRVVSSTGTGWSAVDYTNKTGNMSGGTVNTISLAYNNSRRFTFGSNSIAPYTWTGSSSSDWFTPANWSGNVVPSASNNATIAIGTNSPIIQGAFIAQTNNLTINNGVALTLKPGGKLTVNGTLEINQTNGLILENNTEINGLASVITKGNITGTGNSNVKLTLTKDSWYYITSAVNNAVLGNFSTGNPDATVHVYRNNQWYSTGVANVNTPLLKLEGVLVKYATNPTFTINYSGTLNNGTVERTFTAGGWYLFGNPYPSFINWQNDAGWNRPNIDGTMWYRSRIGETMTFITYNRLAPAGARVALYPSGTFGNENEMANIPPNQAVWIKAYAATTLSVNNDGRTHGVATSQLKSSSVKSEADVIRIVAANSQSKDGAVIYFDDSATNGYDVRDSEKRFNDSKLVPEVYTRISNTSLAINGLKPLENSDISIPLSVRNGNLDDVTLTIDLSLFNAMHTVTLEDLKTGEVTNLRGTDSYTYKPLVTGDVHDRFVIHLKYVVTSVVNPDDNQNQVDNNDISISGVKGKAVVKISSYLLDMDDAQIEVYTLTGQRVSATTSAASLTLVNLPNTEAVYVIKVMAGGKTKTEKVVGKAN